MRFASRRMASRVVALALAAIVLPACNDCELEIITPALPDATVGVAYFVQIGSACGGDQFFLQDGTLPPGIGLLDDGQMRGTPTQAGVFTFTVGVLDFSFGEIAFRGYALKVDAP